MKFLRNFDSESIFAKPKVHQHLKIKLSSLMQFTHMQYESTDWLVGWLVGFTTFHSLFGYSMPKSVKQLSQLGFGKQKSRPPHIAEKKQDEHTYSSYVRIRNVALTTYRRRWTIGRSGERGTGISVPAAWHDDDDNDSLVGWLCDVSAFWGSVNAEVRSIFASAITWF